MSYQIYVTSFEYMFSFALVSVRYDTNQIIINNNFESSYSMISIMRMICLRGFAQVFAYAKWNFISVKTKTFGQICVTNDPRYRYYHSSSGKVWERVQRIFVRLEDRV